MSSNIDAAAERGNRGRMPRALLLMNLLTRLHTTPLYTRSGYRLERLCIVSAQQYICNKLNDLSRLRSAHSGTPSPNATHSRPLATNSTTRIHEHPTSSANMIFCRKKSAGIVAMILSFTHSNDKSIQP